MLSVLLRYTDSDYPFGIFKLFLSITPGHTNVFPFCYIRLLIFYTHVTYNKLGTNRYGLPSFLTHSDNIVDMYIEYYMIFRSYTLCFSSISSLYLSCIPHPIGFTTTYASGAYHHWCCGFDSRPGRGVQHYVIKFVSDLWQVGGFLRVLRFPPPIKPTATV